MALFVLFQRTMDQQSEMYTPFPTSLRRWFCVTVTLLALRMEIPFSWP